MPALDPASVRHFHEEGYLAAEGILDVERDIQPVVEEYTALLDRLVRRWHAEGHLPSTYADLPFGQRLARVLEAGLPYYQHLDISLPQNGVQPDTPIHLGPAVFALLRSPRLLDAVESLIGPEIYSNPVQHVRIKPPERLVPPTQRNSLIATTDWHQDQGVVLADADETAILTVWVAISDATPENGCLKLVPDSHREGLVTHCAAGQRRDGTPRAGLHIPDSLLREPEAIPVPLRRGGVLFMHRRTMHASLPNSSDDIRWSFDLRYNPIGQPTGRPAFPGFVARSRRNPAAELCDAAAWAQLWLSARERLADGQRRIFNRWLEPAPVCA